MKEDDIPVVPHDDGIFAYSKRLEFGQTHVVEFAKDVIEAYRQKERERVGKLKRPVTKVLGVPEDFIMKQMRERAGIISFAPGQLHSFTTKEEHLNAKDLGSFIMHPEPVYESQSSAAKYHGDHCWKTALLNAFRILDLAQDTEVEFPYGWIPLNIEPEQKNYAGLMASAAYQMGLYYGKAQAMEKAAFAIRGEPMLDAKAGHYSPLGNLIYAACEVVEYENGKLPKRGASKEVMSVLERQGQASTTGGLWRIFVKDSEQIVDSKKVGRFIKRYRDREP